MNNATNNTITNSGNDTHKAWRIVCVNNGTFDLFVQQEPNTRYTFKENFNSVVRAMDAGNALTYKMQTPIISKDALRVMMCDFSSEHGKCDHSYCYGCSLQLHNRAKDAFRDHVTSIIK